VAIRTKPVPVGDRATRNSFSLSELSFQISSTTLVGCSGLSVACKLLGAAGLPLAVALGLGVRVGDAEGATDGVDVGDAVGVPVGAGDWVPVGCGVGVGFGAIGPMYCVAITTLSYHFLNAVGLAAE